MRKIIYIGGIGSDSYTVGLAAGVLSSYFDTNVAGFSFREAYRQGALIAQLSTDSLVITHSAGMVLLRHIVPKELIAIAPPMPTPREALLFRSIPKTVALLKNMGESTGRPRRVYDYHVHAFAEHLLWPQYNLLQIRRVSSFDAAQVAVEMLKGGGKVTLAFMEHDLLFPDAVLHPHIEVARKQGVNICNMVIGQHDEFVLYPAEVLTQVMKK